MTTKFRRKVLCNALIVALAASAAMTSAYAQEPVKSFDVPMQPAASGLNAFAEQADITLVFSQDLVAGVNTRPLRGSYSVTEGLSRMLEGTRLSYRLIGESTVAISTRSSSDAVAAASNQEELTSSVPKSSSQTEAGETKVDVTELETIVVTGSHIRDSQAAGSKVIVIDRAAIDASGYGRVQDVLATLTQNFNAVSEANPGLGDNWARGQEVQLRGLGSGTTLTLIDGQRKASGGTSGALVDVSTIPASAIERIEILPDGASALYGSDAIGGVLNIILRRDFEGIETRLRASSADGEAAELQGAVLWGGKWESGNLLLGYDYYHRDDLPSSAHPYTASNGDFRPFGGTDQRQVGGNPGTIYEADGATLIGAIPAGQDGTNLLPSQVISGQVNHQDFVSHRYILPNQEKHSVFLSASQDIGGDWEAFSNAIITARKTRVELAPVSRVFSVPASNAFNRFGRTVIVRFDLTDDFDFANYSDTKVYDFSAGVRGSLSSSWQLKTAANYSNEENRFRSIGFAVNAAAVPAFLSSADPSVALNVFGDGINNDPATISAIRGDTHWLGDSSTWSVSAIADGPLVSLPAGSVKLALGGDLRGERTHTDLNQFGSAPKNVEAKRNVSALFAELAIPILAGSDRGAGRVDASLAGRYEDYNDFGETFNPKVGVDWWVSGDVKLRGTWGTSFRAPPFNLTNFVQSLHINFTVPDPTPSNPANMSSTLLLLGTSPGIKEERGTVWTAGVDFDPRSMPGLSFSATIFDINYEDKIATAGNFFEFLAQESVFGSVITRNPTQQQVDALCNAPVSVVSCLNQPYAAILDARLRNLSGVRTRGIDVGASYDFETSIGRWSASLDSTYTNYYKVQLTDTAPQLDVVDTVSNPLSLRFGAAISWNLAGASASLRVAHQGDYRESTVASSRKVDSWTRADLNLGYHFDQGVLEGTHVSVGVNNLFNNRTPFVNSAALNSQGYDYANGSLLGRTLSLQVVYTAAGRASRGVTP